MWRWDANVNEYLTRTSNVRLVDSDVPYDWADDVDMLDDVDPPVDRREVDDYLANVESLEATPSAVEDVDLFGRAS